VALRPVRDARTLKAKAIASLKAGMMAFNSYQEDGRQTAVLLHLQHACEMLLKAVLLQKKQVIFDKVSGRSFAFEHCVKRCAEAYGLTPPQAGIMRSISKLRDAEQHWMVHVDEGLLYLDVRALVTAFDEYMQSVFEDHLAHHIPPRVLPVSSVPPADFDVLIDEEYSAIRSVLGGGQRRRDEARGRIRSLLAMEAIVAENAEISEKDVDRVEKAIKADAPLLDVFPRLRTIGMSVDGAGTTFTVKFSKKEGAPVRFVAGDDPDAEAAAAIRQVDLQAKYHLSATELAEKVGLSVPKCSAVRKHLEIDEDDGCHKKFAFGKTEHPRFSDNAVRRIKEALPELDVDTVYKEQRRGR